jgi:hypothetical protein
MKNDDLPLYQIVDWNRHFENNRSRQRDKCAFVCIPNKHGGSGLSNLLAEPNGWGLYGIWVLIVEMCSRQLPPREGHLTNDGRRDGWRLGSEELAHTLRVPASEVRRCLAAVSSKNVGFMKLIAGKPEVLESMLPQVTAETITSSDNPDGHSECHEPGHGKKEGMKERNSLSKGGEKEPEEDLIQHPEAKILFGKLSKDLFGKELRENQWTAQMEYDLDQISPIRREEWELVNWIYRLPKDHEIFQLTHLRQSIEAVLQNFSREVQKVRSVRKRLGLSALGPAGDEAEPANETTTEWTRERRAAWETMFPGCYPGPYHLLERQMREQIDSKAKEIETKNAP